MKKQLAVIATVAAGVLATIGIVAAVASASPTPSCACSGPVRSTIDGTTFPAESQATSTTAAPADGAPSIMPIGSLPISIDPTTPPTGPIGVRQISVHGHGSSSGSGVSSTDQRLQDRARVAAMADARHRAATYATAAGASVGAVLSISESASSESGTPSSVVVNVASVTEVDVTVVYELV